MLYTSPVSGFNVVADQPFINTVKVVLSSSEHWKKKKYTCYSLLNPISYLHNTMKVF